MPSHFGGTPIRLRFFLEETMSEQIKGKRKRKIILNKFNSRCAYCGTILTYNILNIDHIDPYGGDEISNLNPSCKSCNSTKHTRSIEKFRSLFIHKKLQIPKFTDEQKKYLLENYHLSIDIKFYYEEFNVR
jgi:5-methylcytosine-specific restriction endonuclease McrA